MNMKEKNKTGSAVVSVSLIVIVAKILGFLKQMITAKYFGATIQTDLISISEGLITNIDYLLVQTLMTAFVPTYIHIKNKGKQEERKFVSNTIIIFFLVSLTITIVLEVAAPIFSKLLAPTYTADNTRKLAYYIRLVSPTLIALVISAIYNSLLKGNESFVPGEFVSIIHSLVPIAFIVFLASVLGPDVLVYSFISYAIVTLFFLSIYSKKLWNLKIVSPLKDENVITLLKMMGPLLLGYSIVFVNQQVDKIIVSGLGEGVVSAMGYASVLSNFVCTFIGSISGVLFVYITKNIADGKKEEAASFLIKSTGQMVTLVLPIFVLTVCNSLDIVTIVFGRGEFDETAIKTCALSLVGYGFMFIPFVLRELFSRFQYGYGDSKHPMINSSIGIGINIVSSIVLSRFFGVLGVTIATSISVLVCGVLNIRSSMLLNDAVRIHILLKNIIPWLLGGVMCIVVSYFGNILLVSMSTLLRLVIIVVVSLLLYFLINIRTIMPMIGTFIHKR